MPHLYQQILSAEKTPTLWGTLPAFKGLITKLTEHTTPDLEVGAIIEDGILKLQKYQQETDAVPAYTLATCE